MVNEGFEKVDDEGCENCGAPLEDGSNEGLCPDCEDEEDDAPR